MRGDEARAGSDNSFRFFLGTHHPEWLDQTDVPLFVSRRQLARRKRLPRALGPWALDSGGFTELNAHGRWTIGPEAYADEVRRYASEVGRLEWAAIQDWMCEPFVLSKTKLTIAEHQRRSVESYLRLRELAPEVPWAPVLQGWLPSDYWQHADDYEAAGVDLRAAPAVGVGSVCRRQGTQHVAFMLSVLREERGLENLHGFGFKTQGLVALFECTATFGVPMPFASADSLAWSFHARREKRPFYDECTHKNCANCLRFALSWREDLLQKIARPAADAQRQMFARTA